VTAVALRDVVRAIRSAEYYQRGFLNRQTGELFSTEDGEDEAAQEPDSPDVAAWDLARITKIREAMRSPDWIPLSVSFDGRRSADRFCEAIPERSLREELAGALKCCTPWEEFQRVLRCHGFAEAWAAFYDREFEQFTARWLDLHGIRYTP
jgi:hypothetical protein